MAAWSGINIANYWFPSESNRPANATFSIISTEKTQSVLLMSTEKVQI